MTEHPSSACREARATAARQLSFEQAVSAAGDAVEGLDAKRALAEQIDLVRGGLRAASDAVRLATNQAAWQHGG